DNQAPTQTQEAPTPTPPQEAPTQQPTQGAPKQKSAQSELPPIRVQAPRRQQPTRAPARVVTPQPQEGTPAATTTSPPSDTAGTVGYLGTQTSTATKTNTPLINVPQSVTVLTKEFIRDQNFQSLTEALRYVPGVIPHQGEGNRDQVIIRGQ